MSVFDDKGTTPDILNLNARKLAVIMNRPNNRTICPKDANGMTNNADPDQTAPLCAV